MSEMTSRKKTTMVVAAGLLVVAVAVWWVAIRNSNRDADIARRRDIYNHFAPMPGSEKIGEHIEEIRGDGEPTGHWRLQVTYRVGETVSAADVLAYYRTQIPTGWTEASDATCAAVLANSPPPPPTSPPPGAAGPVATIAPAPTPTAAQFSLMFRRSNLTVFAPNMVGTNGQREGLSILLSAETGDKTVTLDSVTYGCGADSTDRAADTFDAA
ncbi:MAG: hypothetical protein AB7N61_19610 [Acidimicrobiia bacterium]